MNAVIAYIRVSRVGGRSGESFISPREQMKAIEALAQSKGLTVMKWIEELDESGGNSNRPKWHEAIRAVERGEVDGIAVWNLSRFSRSVKDAIVSLERIENAGGRLYSAREDFDTTTAAGRAMRTQMFAWAQMEREVAGERFAVSTRNAIERGVWIAAKVPFGYLKDATTKRLVPDPVTAALLVEAFERKARGESVSGIQRWLDSLGYPMGRSSVGGLLANEAYLGLTRQGHVRNESAHPAIVARELFERARAARGVRPSRTGALANCAMLKSLVKCSTCGGTMLVTWTNGARVNGTREKIPAYACCGRNKGGCPNRAYIRVDVLDAHVDSLMMAIFAADGPVAEIIASTERLQVAVQRLADAEHALAELRALDFTSAGISLESHVAMVKSAEARLDMSRSEYGNAKNEASALDIEGDLRVVWPTLSSSQKREILHRFVSRIVVRPTKGKRSTPVEDRVQIIDGHGVLLNHVPTTKNATFIITRDGKTRECTEAEAEVVLGVFPQALKEDRVRTFLPDEAKDGPREAWASYLQVENPAATIRPS